MEKKNFFWLVCISVLLATFSSCKKEVIDNEPIAEEEETVEEEQPPAPSIRIDEVISFYNRFMNLKKKKIKKK